MTEVEIPTGHTPAPWEIAVDEDHGNLRLTGPSGEEVVAGCGCCDSPYMNCGEQNAPNARLIALAPAMAEELVALRAEVAALKARAALSPAPQAQDGQGFQARVQPWLMACFGPEISGDRVERGDRLLEEVFELLQSGGYDPARVVALRDYVWSREVGEPSQEVGGVMVTLAAYCLAHGLDMHAAAEAELARVWTKVEKIRAKQAAKPVGSALPQTWTSAPQALAGEAERIAKMEAALAKARERIEMARLLTDTGAVSLGKTMDYSPSAVEAILRHLDTALAALAEGGRDNG